MNVLRNVGLIMDGNGRWAQEQGKRRLEGHTQGIVTMISLISYAFDCGVENIVCYGLSTENLQRPQDEILHIYDLILEIYDRFVSMMHEKKAYVKYVGNISVLPRPVRESMEKAERELSVYKDSGRTAFIGVVYGSRAEIIRAVNNAIDKGEKLTEERFLSQLDVPIDLELIIRTGGEQRLSNFMLYQASYSELYFSEKYFPDFNQNDMESVFQWYHNRKRRFGLIK